MAITLLSYPNIIRQSHIPVFITCNTTNPILFLLSFRGWEQLFYCHILWNPILFITWWQVVLFKYTLKCSIESFILYFLIVFNKLIICLITITMVLSVLIGCILLVTDKTTRSKIQLRIYDFNYINSSILQDARSPLIGFSIIRVAKIAVKSLYILYDVFFWCYKIVSIHDDYIVISPLISLGSKRSRASVRRRSWDWRDSLDDCIGSTFLLKDLRISSLGTLRFIPSIMPLVKNLIVEPLDPAANFVIFADIV